MMRKLRLAVFSVAACCLISACGESVNPGAVALAPEVDAAAPSIAELPSANGDVPTPTQTVLPPPSVTVHELMRDVIEPNAQRIWRAVSYTATAGGVEETMPINDMDWDGLHQSAIVLVEAGHGLTVENRDIGSAAYELVRQDFQYTGDEIAALRIQNSDDWNAIAVEMGVLAREVLDTIDRRDIFALTETGAELNQACEACHAAYWYRP